MLSFIKRHIFIILIFIFTLSVTFLTFLIFIGKSFIFFNDNNLNYLLYLNIGLLLLFFMCFKLNAEIIVLSKCDHKEDGFLKNEYILNLNELTMTRNYVYNEKTYKKYRITDLSVKKSNSFVRNIYEEEGKILTLKH